MYNDGSMGSVSGNIYNGLHSNNIWYPSIETGLSSKDQYWGISLADTVKYKKAQLLLGVHKHNASVDSYNKITGRVTQTVGSNALCPTYGFVYQPMSILLCMPAILKILIRHYCCQQIC